MTHMLDNFFMGIVLSLTLVALWGEGGRTPSPHPTPPPSSCFIYNYPIIRRQMLELQLHLANVKFNIPLFQIKKN